MLFRNTLLYLPAQFLGPLSQFAALLLWTHVADSRTIGVVTLVTASQELLTAVFLGFWSQYALRHMDALNGSGQGRSLQSTATYVLSVSVAAQSAAALALLSTLIDPDAGLGLKAAVVLLAASRTANVYLQERARVGQDILHYSVQILAGPVLGLALGAGLLVRLGSDPLWPILGYAVAQSGAALLGMFRDRGWIGVGRPDAAIIRAALTYGGPLLLGGLFNWLSANAGRFLVDERLGLEAAGAYSVGFGLGARAATLAALAVTAAAYPLAVSRMNAGDRAGAFDQLADNGTLLIGVVTPSLLGLYLVSDALVRLLIAPAYWATTLQILPWALLAGAAGNVRAHFLQQAFLLDGKTTPAMALSSAEALLSVSLCFVLITLHGLVGGAMGVAVASLIALFCAFPVARRRGLRVRWGDLARIALSACALYGAVEAVPGEQGLTSLALKIAAGAAAYAATAAILFAPKLGRFKPTRGGARRWSERLTIRRPA